MRILIEIVVLLIAAAIGATATLTVLAVALFSLPGPIAGLPLIGNGAGILWTSTLIAGTAFWPLVAATAAARLIAGVMDQSRVWRWTALYAAGLMAAVTGWLTLMGPAHGAGFGLLFVIASAIGAATAGGVSTALVNRVTR